MKFHISKQFRWDIAENIPHFYQVTTKSQRSKVKILTIMACDVDEVCRKVKQQFKNVIIDKIIKFNKPALNGGNVSSTAHVDVTPTLKSCVTCCDLLTQPESSSNASSESGDFHLSSYLGNILSPKITPKPRRIQPTLAPVVNEKVVELGHHQDTTSNYTYYGSGIINFGSLSVMQANDAGVLTQSIIFSETLTDVLISDIFVAKATIPIPQAVQTIQTPCCSQLTSCLEFKHTLHQILPLANFLQANNLTMPGILRVGSRNINFIKLNYASRFSQWRGNLHFIGQSTQGSFTESWDIGITFSCIHRFWQFAVILNNTQPQFRAISRLVLYYLKTDVCPDNDSFSKFNFMLDGTLLSSQPATSQPVVLNDEAGFFSNLQIEFSIVAQNQSSASHQFYADNTVPYDNSFISSGGV